MAFPESSPVFPPGVDQQAIGYDVESELVERAALLQIRNHLEEEIQFQERVWEDRDKHMAEATDDAFQRVVLDQVQPEDFHQGSRPSLVEAPHNRWPLVVVRCNDGTPLPAPSQFDQFDTFGMTLIIEVLCQAGPYETLDSLEHGGEDLVNRRTQRTASAVMRCIRRDTTLGGVAYIPLPPRITPSMVWTKRGDEGSTGPYFYRMGKELQYGVQKHSQ